MLSSNLSWGQGTTWSSKTWTQTMTVCLSLWLRCSRSAKKKWDWMSSARCAFLIRFLAEREYLMNSRVNSGGGLQILKRCLNRRKRLKKICWARMHRERMPSSTHKSLMMKVIIATLCLSLKSRTSIQNQTLSDWLNLFEPTVCRIRESHYKTKASSTSFLDCLSFPETVIFKHTYCSCISCLTWSGATTTWGKTKRMTIQECKNFMNKSKP